MVLMRYRDAWVQRRCPAGCMLCAQLPLDSQVWRRWQLPNQARPRLLPRARAACSAAACFRAALRCLHTITMRGCSGAAQRAGCCVHSCHRIRRCGGAGNCRIKHDRGFCRAHELLTAARLACGCSCIILRRSQYARAATLLGKACALCTAASLDARWLRRRWQLQDQHDRGFCRAHKLVALAQLACAAACDN